jgi:hypothetical protein
MTVASRVNSILGRTIGIRFTRAQPRYVAIGEWWFVRLRYFDMLLDEIGDISGDVVECGVASGTSLAMLASLLRARGESRHIWGFDSWRGLPQPSATDLSTETSVAAERMFSHASIQGVYEELAAYGLTDSHRMADIRLVPGYFADTVPKFSGRVALLHIDADLYHSYKTCLGLLWDKIQRGGVVALDEYEDPSWPGATKAVEEFVASQPAGSIDLNRNALSGKWWMKKVA